METQNQIKLTISEHKAIEQIKKLLDENPVMNRTQIAGLVCDRFNFFDPRGNQLQEFGKVIMDGYEQNPVKYPPKQLFSRLFSLSLMQVSGKFLFAIL